jgi:hypothetical protein
MTDTHESRPGEGGLRVDPNDTPSMTRTPDTGREAAPHWTGCPLGCGPDGHEPGCWVGRDLPGPWVLFIDRGGRLHWNRKRRRTVATIDAPRPGCCAICGFPLDEEALRAGDNRCTRCYRQRFAQRRAQILGGAR